MSKSEYRNREIAPSTVTKARSERVLSEIVTPVVAVVATWTCLVEMPAYRSSRRQNRPNSSRPTLLKKLTGWPSRATPQAKIADALPRTVRKSSANSSRQSTGADGSPLAIKSTFSSPITAIDEEEDGITDS